MAEVKFARFEALLSRTNIFSTPKVPVTSVSAPVSDQPFFAPSDPRGTGLVRPPGPDVEPIEKKNKGPGKKTKKSKPVATSSNLPPVPDDSETGDIIFNQPHAFSKVDTPGPGGFVKLGQAVSTVSSVLSATEPHPIVSSGGSGASSGPVTEAVPEDSDVESVTGRLEKKSLTLRRLSKMRR